MIERRRRGLWRRRRIALVLPAALLVGAVVTFGPAAFAQEPLSPEGAVTTLMSVETVNDSVVIVRAPEKPQDVAVTIGAVPASVSSVTDAEGAGRSVQTVLVIDNGAESTKYLEAFISAARDYVAAAPESEQIAVWTTGGKAHARAVMTTDRTRLDAVLEAVVSGAGTNYMWDAVRGAALDLEDTAVGSTNMVVFAGSPDSDSLTTAVEARGAAMAAHVSVFVVASDDQKLPLDSLARLVSVTPAGGFATESDVALLSGYGSSVSNVIQGTWFIGFTADNLLADNQIDVKVGTTVFSASFVPGSVTTGSALIPFRPGGSDGLEILRGTTGKAIGIATGAVAAALAAYALVMLFQKDVSGLNSTLMPYTERFGIEADADQSTRRRFPKNLFVKAAVQLTEDIAERQGVMSKSEALLERADLPLRVGEALSGYAAIALLSAVIGLLVGETITAMIFFGTLGLMIPPMFVKMKAGRRRKKFMNLLPDTLQLLSSTLKAGYSFMQGVDAVSQEIDEPMAGELRRIVAESQLGRPVEEAMDASAERMNSDDFAWAVMAVKIQREVGGNLSELLLTVAETMTERERLRRDVASLTAEGKMSAIILGALPILLGVAMWALNKEYIELLFTDPFGKVILTIAIIAAVAGFAWMKKIITIDI